MKKRVYLLQFSLLAGLIGFYFGCNKTDHPFGVDAPYGLDVPTLTPTPGTGAIEVYVSDTGAAIQSVNIYLLDPAGNTFNSQTTQPVVGYAAFNPPVLTSGVWHAVVPSQSVSYVTSGPVTIKKTYGYSVIPINVTGSGQYAATFSTGGNIVRVSPVTQAYQFSNPSNIPVTVSYYQNGNLDVPVSVTMSMNPTIAGINFLSPANWVFGGSNLIATDIIGKNICYYNPVTLSLATSDFSGNPINTNNATISRGFSIPVTLVATKVSGAGVTEYLEIGVQTADDCGASIYNVSFTLPANGTYTGTVANGGYVSVNEHSLNYNVSSSVTLPGGGVINGSSFFIANIPFNTWTVIGTGSY